MLKDEPALYFPVKVAYPPMISKRDSINDIVENLKKLLAGS